MFRKKTRVPEDGLLAILIGTWFMSSRVIISVSLVFATLLGLASVADSVVNSKQKNLALQLVAEEFVTTVAFHIDTIDYTGAANLAELFQGKSDVISVFIKDRYNFAVYGDQYSIDTALRIGGTLFQYDLIAPIEGENNTHQEQDIPDNIGKVAIVLQLTSVLDMVKSVALESLARFLIYLVVSAVVLALCIRLLILPPLSLMKDAIAKTMQTGEHVQTSFHSGSLMGEILSQFNSMQSNLSQSKQIQEKLFQNVQEAHLKIKTEQGIRNQQLVVLGSTFKAVGIHFSLFDADGENIYTTVTDRQKSKLIHNYLNLGITDVSEMSNELKKAGFTFSILPRETITDYRLVYSFEVRDTQQMESWKLQAFQLHDSTLSIVCIDTSDLKRAESRIEQLRKMESLGILTSGVAHEFNNVLAIISNNVELALLDENIVETHRTLLTSAMSAIERATSTVEDLLAYSRKGNLEGLRELPLSQIVQDVQEMVASIAAEKVKVITSSIGIPLLVKADRDRLMGALTNLVINGVHAVADHGDIQINIRLAHTAELSENDLDISRFNIAIGIRDSGCGIPEAIRDKIFDPFFTTKKNGSGLGLWATFNSIQNMGGAIQYKPVESGGSQFIVYLPACETPVENFALETEPQLPGYQIDSVLKGKHIFVMDDEEHYLEVTQSYLTSLGVNVSVATSVSEASKLLADTSRAVPLHIAICDLHLPDGSGMIIAKKIRVAHPHCTVIVLSGNPELVGDEELVDMVLRKPLRLVSLREILENLYIKSPAVI